MPDSSPPVYGLVLAGGSGSRFWPLSRNDKPKQLLKLFDDETLLEKAVRRLDGLVPPGRILVLTNHAQLAGVKEVLPWLPEENFFAEPDKRDTGPAIALGIGAVARRDPEAVMMVLPADQLIADAEGFRSVMAAAVEAAAKGDAIVTLGIKPTWPCPGYGYIERGARARISGVEGGHPVHEVVRFREKPDTDLAERFLADGHFSWNAGIFVWSIATVMRELARHCPELADFVTELRHSRDFDATVAAQFPKLTRISVDYALMEKATRVFNIEADIGWDDVGGWVSVGKYLEQAGRDNATRGPVTLLDSYNNVVYSSGGARVALLGVHDLVVVQTSDAVLVADKDEADRIKKLVEDLPPELC